MMKKFLFVFVFLFVNSFAFSQKYNSLLGVSLGEPKSSVTQKLGNKYKANWKNDSYHIEKFILGSMSFTDGYFYFIHNRLEKAVVISGWNRDENTANNTYLQIYNQYVRKYGQPHSKSGNNISWSDRCGTILISKKIDYDTTYTWYTTEVTYTKASSNNNF